MASIYNQFFSTALRIKGDHCYRSNPRTNEVWSCIPEPSNTYSHDAVVVKMKNTKGERDVITVGNVPDSLGELL